jgi:hypothetical protein
VTGSDCTLTRQGARGTIAREDEDERDLMVCVVEQRRRPEEVVPGDLDRRGRAERPPSHSRRPARGIDSSGPLST